MLFLYDFFAGILSKKAYLFPNHVCIVSLNGLTGKQHYKLQREYI